MNAQFILDRTKTRIPAVLAQSLVIDACAVMREHKSAAVLVVSDRGQVAGLLSRNQVVRTAGRVGSTVMTMKCNEICRDIVHVCTPDTPVDDILRRMHESGESTLVVVEEGRIRGIVSLDQAVGVLMGLLDGSIDLGSVETGAEAPAASAPAADIVPPAMPGVATTAVDPVPQPAVQPAPAALAPAYPPQPSIQPTHQPAAAQYVAQPVLQPLTPPQQPGQPANSSLAGTISGSYAAYAVNG